MANDKPTGNPIFDIWLTNQQQFLKAQEDWMQPNAVPENPFMNVNFLDRSVKSWQLCEEQYDNWMKAAKNWMTGSAASESSEHQEEEYSAQALNYLLNPATFMKSGFEIMDQVFRKLVNGPEFADIGMLEKKMLKSGEDWQNFKDAGQHYQEVISAAWLRAYNHFSDEFMDSLNEESTGSEEMLKRWLKIADEELVNTLRSDEFLDAQREFFAAGSSYRLKYQEFVDMWCDNHGIPTRSEVDDLHKIIYDLRREVRTLKRNIEKSESKKAAPKKKAPVKAKTKKKTAKKATVKVEAKEAKSGNTLPKED